MAKQYISVERTLSPRSRSKRRRETGGGGSSTNVTIVQNVGSSSPASSIGDGHAHDNKSTLDKLGIDGEGYVTVTDWQENGDGDLEKATSKIKAGYADRAAEAQNLAEDSTDWQTIDRKIEENSRLNDEKYLRKDQDDIAAEQIGFLKGLWIKAKDLFGIDADGDAKLNNLSVEGVERVNDIKSANYTGDTIADTGFLLTANSNGHSKLTIDELYVRMRAVYESLEVKKWQVSAGDEIKSCAANVVLRVDYYQSVKPAASEQPLGYSYVRVPWLVKGAPFILKFLTGVSGSIGKWVYSKMAKERHTLSDDDLAKVRMCRCYFLAKDGTTEIENWWMENDLARCNTQNVVNTRRETYTSIQQKQGNVFWWRKVCGVSTQPVELDQGKYYHYFDVEYNPSLEDESHNASSIYCMYGSDIPAAGDNVVQFGNAIIPGRMNLIITQVNGGSDLTHSNGDAPCIKLYKGIYCFDISKCWFGGPTCKMKLSHNGYEFYGADFRFIREYDNVPATIQRGAWLDILFSDDDYDRTRPAYSDDATSGRTSTQARKCYYYDEVSHKGSIWLCSIIDGAHWVDGNGRYMSDAAYAALTVEQKSLCSRKENYTIEEPSEQSADWVKLVAKGDPGAFKSRVFCRTNENIRTVGGQISGGSYGHPWPGGTDPCTQTYTIGNKQVRVTWHDGAPTDSDAMLWSTVCTFYSDGSNSGWSNPSPETDTDTLDIEFSPNTTQPNVPYGTDAKQKDSQTYISKRQEQGWYDPGRLPANQTMIWRAERKISNGEYDGDWVVTRIYGEKGDAGSSPIALYRWFEEGATVTKPTVTAAQWAADQLQGWSKTAPNRPRNGWHLWMSQNTLYFDGSIGTWSNPIQISGATGTPGEGSDRIEWIYKLSADLTPTIPTTSPNTDKYEPSGWTNHPSGVDKDNIYELACYRTKDAGANVDPTKVWSAWKGTGENPDKPIVWSHWGRNGMDGDGFEYAFIRTKNNVAPTILNDDTYVDTNGNNYAKEEHLPQVDATGRTDIENNQSRYQCTDDHKGTSREWPYEWCAKRTMNDADTTTGKRTWKWYSGTMKLWGSHPENVITLDIDNELDTVQTESDGKIKSDRQIMTVVRLYDGANKANMDVSKVSVTGGPQSPIAIYANPRLETGGKGIILSWTFKAGNVMAATYDITITYNYVSDGLTFTRTAQFTITASMGQAVYQLSPSLSALPCSRNQNNVLNNPAALSLRIVKLDGSSTNMIDATSGNLSTWGLVVRYAKGASASMPASKDAGTAWPTENNLNTILATDENVYIAMFKSDGALLDRETIPVVKDGATGAQGPQGNQGPQGADGVSPSAYSLVASPSSLNFRADPTGALGPNTLTTVCTPMKTVGNVVTEKSTGDYYLCYRLVWSNGPASYVVAGKDTDKSVTVSLTNATRSNPLVAIDFVLSSTNGVSASSVIIASIRVPIMVDGLNGAPGAPGSPGAPGRIFYSMGEWKSSACPYTRTDLLVPLVHYGDQWNANLEIYGNYYYLDADSSSAQPGTSGSGWELANDFGVVIMQALFANFAKLGKGIFSGDYLFSMNGCIGHKEYTNAAPVTTGGKPAYTYFVGDPHATISKKNANGTITLATLNLQEGMSLTLKFSGSVNTGTGYISIYQNGVLSARRSISTSNTTWNFDVEDTDVYTIVYSDSSSSVKATFNLEYIVTGAFEPNWFVDLLTGKMVAARGNFLVNPDGTVKALNFFHNVCVYIEGNHYSYLRYYCKDDFFDIWRDNWVDNFTAGEYYTAKEVYDLSEGEIDPSGSGAVDGMERCTYDADIINMNPNGSRNWSSETDNKTVYLPDPSDFEGKTVEVTSFNYGYTGSKTAYVGCVKDLAFIFKVKYENGWIKNDETASHPTVTINTGTPVKFVSIKTYTGYFWLQIQ